MNIARPGKAYHIGDCTCFKMISPVYNFGGVAPTPVNVGVKTINTIDPDGDGNFKINPGTNISVSTAANGVTISASGGGTSGVSSVNNITGAVQVQAADSSITVTNSGQNISIKANGISSTYRYESVSLMTYITNACLSQGISFKDFAVNGVPLYFPFPTIYNNSTIARRSVGEDKFIITNDPAITSPTGGGNVGLIKAYASNQGVLGFWFDVYIADYSAVQRFPDVYDRKTTILFNAVKEASGWVGTGYNHSFGMVGSEDETMENIYGGVATYSQGYNTLYGEEVVATTLLGYGDNTNLAKVVKSVQLNSFSGGGIPETQLLVLSIMLRNIYIVRKFTTGV
jgi:hypothetical protein